MAPLWVLCRRGGPAKGSEVDEDTMEAIMEIHDPIGWR
jgi:hypothetical protein